MSLLRKEERNYLKEWFKGDLTHMNSLIYRPKIKNPRFFHGDDI